MHSLFIDSTSGLVIGLLDPKYNWIEYMSLNEKKPSEIIHFEIFNILKKHNLKFSNIQIFISSGPGSYTGMRLSEGIAQVFELEKIPVYSFYHFEVPRLSGIDSGFWVTNAFKGQAFIFKWDKMGVEKHLVDKEKFVIENEKFGFTLDNTDSLFLNLISTKSILKDKAPEIFSKILSQQLRVSPYYFRSLEEEFH